MALPPNGYLPRVRCIRVVPTPLPFVVRPIALGDPPSILSLAKALGKWFNEPGLAQMARDLEHQGGYVAVREADLLGFVMWTPADRDTAELSWMGVAEASQHQGIGTVLLGMLGLEVRTRGWRYLVVSTVADSMEYEPYAQTRRFYRARGFVDYRTDSGYWGEGAGRYDRLVLRLDLDALAREVRAHASGT